jgi:hypothetical protein
MNSLSKMKYKIVKKKLLRTQSPNIPKSHCHIKRYYFPKEKKEEG